MKVVSLMFCLINEIINHHLPILTFFGLMKSVESPLLTHLRNIIVVLTVFSVAFWDYILRYQPSYVPLWVSELLFGHCFKFIWIFLFLSLSKAKISNFVFFECFSVSILHFFLDSSMKRDEECVYRRYVRSKAILKGLGLQKGGWYLYQIIFQQ